MKKEKVVQKLKRKLLHRYQSRYHFRQIVSVTQDYAREIIYQNIFDNFCRRNKIENIYYPLGSGSNYGLMYAIARIMEENDIKSVLELGCGQTTIFFHALQRMKKFNVLSFENDEFWGKEVAKQVSHKIYVTPLVEKACGKILYKTYDFSKLKNEKFDFVVIDGPNGTRNHSRFGAMELIKDSHLAKDFILLFDDTNRHGEVETVEFCKKLLDERGIKYYELQIASSKMQTALVTEKFRKVVYY